MFITIIIGFLTTVVKFKRQGETKDNYKEHYFIDAPLLANNTSVPYGAAAHMHVEPRRQELRVHSYCMIDGRLIDKEGSNTSLLASRRA